MTETVPMLPFSRQLAAELGSHGLEPEFWGPFDYRPTALYLEWEPNQLPRRWRRGGHGLAVTWTVDDGWHYSRTNQRTTRHPGERLPAHTWADPVDVARVLVEMLRTRRAPRPASTLWDQRAEAQAAIAAWQEEAAVRTGREHVQWAQDW